MTAQFSHGSSVAKDQLKQGNDQTNPEYEIFYKTTLLVSSKKKKNAMKRKVVFVN